MNSPIYFISDNHFMKKSDPFEKKRRKIFYSLLHEVKESKGTLIIAGDFFDFWFDYRGYIPKEYLDIFEKLKDLKDNDIKIYYILGNHDYWDFGFFNKVFAHKTFKDEFVFFKENKKIMVIHGDGILKKDIGYRLFRKIIRSQLAIFFYNILPPKVGYFIASKITHADKPDSYYKDNELIKNKLIEYANKKCGDIDILLVGHYHQSGIIENNNKKIIFLGDWIKKYLVTIYDNGKLNQISWDK